jgi:S-adenosylmethionine synthetase
LAKKCEVQIAYAIGVAEPVSVMIDLMGTGKLPKAGQGDRQGGFRPAACGHHRVPGPAAAHLSQTAAYGHFGRTEPGIFLGKDQQGGHHP